MKISNKVFADAKPVEHIQALQDSLLSVTPVKKAKTGQRFSFDWRDQKMCFLLVQGECVVKRANDALILAAMKAPSIVGISDFTPKQADFFIQANTAIEYIYLPQDDFLRHVEQHNLWKSVAYSLMYVSSRFSIYMQSTTAIPTYELICNLLYALNDEDFETRASVPAARYIMERTSLSRSNVMKTLSALNIGEHIVIKRGLLLKINKLPDKF